MNHLFPPYSYSIGSPVSKTHATSLVTFLLLFFSEFVNVISPFGNLTVILIKKWWMSITMLFAKMAKFARKHVKNIKPFIELCTEPHINVLPMRSNKIKKKPRK